MTPSLEALTTTFTGTGAQVVAQRLPAQSLGAFRMERVQATTQLALLGVGQR
jgi:hypothetical protein